MRIELEPWEFEHATIVGHRRHAANLAKSDAAHYDTSRMEDNLTASVAGAVAELAAARAFNLYWSGSHWDSSMHGKYRGEPDLVNMEVKRTRTPNNPLVVRWRDVHPSMVNVSVYVDSGRLNVATINGWLPSEEAWKIGIPAKYDRETTRLVSLDKLRKPGEYA